MAKKNGNKAAEKKDTSSLKCVSVQRIAFNHEEVILENSAVKMTLQIKDPDLHDHFEKGKTYDNVFEL